MSELAITLPSGFHETRRWRTNPVSPLEFFNTKPAPLNLTFHADGTIVGPPGPVTIDGVVAGGSSGCGGTAGHTETTQTTKYYQNTNDGTIDSHTTTETTYVPGTYTPPQTTFVPKRTTCPAINLTSKGAGVGIQTMQTGLLKTAFGGDKGPPTPPGIRMQGIYAAAAGFSVQFFSESAVLGCGPDAAREYPYTVVAGPSGAVVKIDAQDYPLNLAIRPNNTLDPGSATPYQVHGRLLIGDAVSGSYNFIPDEQTCPLAVLSPSASILANGGSADNVGVPAGRGSAPR